MQIFTPQEANSLGNKAQAAASKDDKSKADSKSKKETVSLKQGIFLDNQSRKSVKSMAMNSAAKLVFSGGQDQIIKVLDVTTGNCVLTLEGHKGTVLCLNLSKDNELLASGSYDNSARIWNVLNGECSQILEGHTNTIFGIAFSPDNKFVATGSADNTIRVWEVKTGKCQFVLKGHTDAVKGLKWFEKEGKLFILSVSDDKSLRIWDVSTQECPYIFQKPKHKKGIRDIVVTADGTSIVTISDDSDIQFLQFQTLSTESIQMSSSTLKGHDSEILSVVLAANDQLVLTSGQDMKLRVWNAKTRECLQVLQYPSPIFAFSALCHENHLWVLVGVEDKLDFRCVCPLSELKLSVSELKPEVTPNVKDVKPDVKPEISAEKKKTVDQANSRSEIKPETKSETKIDHNKLNVGTEKKCDSKLVNVEEKAGSDIGKNAGNNQENPELTLTGNAIASLQPFSFRTSINSISCTALATDSLHIFTAGLVRTCQVLDLVSRNKVHYGITTRNIRSAAMNSTGNITLLGAQDGTLQILDLKNGNRNVDCLFDVDGAHRDSILCVDVNSDGTEGVSGAGEDDRTVVLWDIPTRKSLCQFVGHTDAVTAVHFDQKGKRIISASKDTTILVWDRDSKNCLLILRGHEGTVNSVDMNSAGTLLASGSDDKTIRLWDLQSGKCALTLHEIQDERSLLDAKQPIKAAVLKVSFSPQGNLLFSWGLDYVYRLWDLDTGQCVESIRSPQGISSISVLWYKNELFVLGAIENTLNFHHVCSLPSPRPFHRVNSLGSQQKMQEKPATSTQQMQYDQERQQSDRKDNKDIIKTQALQSPSSLQKTGEFKLDYDLPDSKRGNKSGVTETKSDTQRSTTDTQMSADTKDNSSNKRDNSNDSSKVNMQYMLELDKKKRADDQGQKQDKDQTKDQVKEQGKDQAKLQGNEPENVLQNKSRNDSIKGN